MRPWINNKDKTKRAGGITQVVECQSSMHKAVGSTPTTTQTHTDTHTQI
jgi:hypothetical protein